MSSLNYQIDQWCAETGIEVEGRLQETQDGIDERGKKARVPKYTIGELLSDDFDPDTPTKKYRSVGGLSVAGREQPGDIPSAVVDVDVDSFED